MAKKPVEYKSMVKSAWNGYTSPKTAKAAVKVMIEQYKLCKQQGGILTAKTYSGPMLGDSADEKTIQQLTATDLDIYKRYKMLAGFPVDDAKIDEILGPEFATNLAWIDGEFKVVTIKYLGMELMAGSLMSMEVLETGVINDFAVELIWNILELDLVSPAAILKFLAPVRLEGFLLSNDKVKTLTENGVHETFGYEDEAEVEEFLEEVADVLRSAFGL